MIGTVADMQFTDKDFHIDLDKEYEEFLERIRGVEESETDEEDLEQEPMILESDEPPLD